MPLSCAVPCFYPTQTLWSDGSEDFDFSASHIYTQFVSVYFIDIDAGVEAIGEEIVDAKIPYERITIEDGEPFVATQNHMVNETCTTQARFSWADLS